MKEFNMYLLEKEKELISNLGVDSLSELKPKIEGELAIYRFIIAQLSLLKDIAICKENLILTKEMYKKVLEFAYASGSKNYISFIEGFTEGLDNILLKIENL